MFQTLTAREYLKADIANNFGLDKLEWADRLAWFDKNEANLDNLLSQAEEPALFYAGVKAWKDVLAGKPIGYMVSLDATSSGLQILACLTGDRQAARLCNVIDIGTRADAYTIIYEEMTQVIGETAKIERDDCKQAIMTSLYGSTAMPKEIFGEGQLLNVFHETMKREAPGAWELNEAYLNMWDPEVTEHNWIMPDNFHVKIKVMGNEVETVHFLNKPYDVSFKVNKPTEKGRSLAANSTHSIDGMIVREVSRRCDYDPAMVQNLRDMLDLPSRAETATEADQMVMTLWDHYKRTGYLSARIMEVLNLDNIGHVEVPVIRALLDSLPEKPFKVVTIHDCFRCLPTYGNDLRRQYNLQLQMIAQSELLTDLVSQIIGRPIHIGKLDPDLYLEIIDTNYALS